MTVGMLPDNWDLGLRDSSLETWSRPTPTSKKLDAIHISKRKVPAPTKDGASSQGYLHACMVRLSKFYRLWPSVLQRELCRVLTTEALVQGETVVSRGAAPTRMLFLVSGKLKVCVPQANTNDGRPGGGAAKKMRKLAVLKRGDTCGEAALLGHNIAHADVVVDSAGAVVLSLSYQDFLMTFKEVLGLRQQDMHMNIPGCDLARLQDRVIYLRSHPLFADVSLADLDLASDSLQLSFLPPGTMLCLGGQKAAEVGGKVYFIAEGECVVRRSTPDHHGNRSWHGLYDADTVSMLGPLDVFGLPQQEPDLFVETVTQVRLFFAKHEDFFHFPPCIREKVESTFRYKVEYLTGRLKGLQKLDRLRRTAGYGAFKYKVGKAVMSSGAALPGVGGAAVMPATKMEESTPGVSGQQANDNHARSASIQQAQQQQQAGNKMDALLYSLRARQTIEALDNSVVALPDKHTGLPPLHSTLAQWEQAQHTSQRQGAVRCMTEPRLTESSGGSYPVFNTQASGGMSGMGTTTIDRNRDPDHGKPPLCGGTWSNRPSKPLPFDLRLMRPKDNAWPKVEGTRPELVHTEAPSPQLPPTTLFERHTLIFQRARNTSPRDRRITQLHQHSDDDDDGEGELRRLSLSNAHSGLLGADSMGSNRFDRWGAGSGQRRISSTGTIPRQSHFIDRDLQRSIDLHSSASDIHRSPAALSLSPNADPTTSTSQRVRIEAAQSTGDDLNATQRGGGRPASNGSSSSSSAGSRVITSPFDTAGANGNTGAGDGPSPRSKAKGSASVSSPPQQQHITSPTPPTLPDLMEMLLLEEGGDLEAMQPVMTSSQPIDNLSHGHQQHLGLNSLGQPPYSYPATGTFSGSAVLLPSSAGRQAEMDLALPPSVLLGYESLDPFQWAAVMSYQQGNAAGPSDSMLPKPNW